MKQILSATLVGALILGGFALEAQAQKKAPYGMAGCGLGSLIITDDGIVQIFAGTTNGTSGNQSFGITSGTSNCTTDGVVTASKEQEAFTETNLANLTHDMASGEGEYLVAFADALGCDASVHPQFFEFAQQNVQSVYPDETTSAQQLLYVFKIKLSKQKTFAANCARL